MLKMDAYILLSIINMKLRDKFHSLNSLCEDYNISEAELKTKLEAIGYLYNQITNQFISS